MSFQIWHEKFGKFSSNHHKVRKCHFDWLFLSKVYEVWAKKYTGVIFHDTEQWCKIWINPDLVAWEIGWTFIRALKSLKHCTFMGSFCPKHIMFPSEKLRGIKCHDTETWCKIFRENWLVAWIITKGIWLMLLHFDQIFLSKA